MLHLAAHGAFRPDNPLFSGLALEDGWLKTLDLFDMRLQASLVVLSACDTNVGLHRAGQGVAAHRLALTLADDPAARALAGQLEQDPDFRGLWVLSQK